MRIDHLFGALSGAIVDGISTNVLIFQMVFL